MVNFIKKAVPALLLMNGFANASISEVVRLARRTKTVVVTSTATVTASTESSTGSPPTPIPTMTTTANPPIITVTDFTTVTTITTAAEEPGSTPQEPLPWDRAMKCVWADYALRVFIVTVQDFLPPGLEAFCRDFWENLYRRSCTSGSSHEQCYSLNGSNSTFQLQAMSSKFCDPKEVEDLFRGTFAGRFGYITCNHCDGPLEGDCAPFREINLGVTTRSI